MFERLRRILEMIRFSHTLFALPFALLAAVMAWTAPAPPGTAADFRWRHLLGILVCMVGARSAAMAFNRIADRRLDAENPRTQNRHLPTGAVSVRGAVFFTLAASLLFVAGTLLFLPNRLPLAFSAPVLVFLFLYSYAKRFTALSHWWLGAALMLAPAGAWIAVRGQVVAAHPSDIAPAALLGLAVLFWVAGFDIIYACQDVAFDRRAGLRSVPARWGVVGSLRLAAVCHLGTLVALALLPLAHHVAGPPLGLGWIYGCGVAAAAVLLVVEHFLVRPDDLTRVNIAFFHVNAVLSIGLFVVGSVDLLV